MILRRYTAAVCVLMLVFAALTGCVPAVEEPAEPPVQTEAPAKQRTVTAMIKTVENGAVSAMEGTYDAVPPEKPDGEDRQDAPADPPDMPADQPQGDGHGGFGFKESGAEVVFTLGEAVSIYIDNGGETAEGSAEDILPGCIVEAVLEGDTAVSLTVLAGADKAAPERETVANGTSAVTLAEDISINGDEYISEGNDENALRVDGAKVTLTGITADKAGGESSDTQIGDFYGMNAALLAQNGSDVILTGASVTSSAANGNGVVSLGEGTALSVSDTVIRTSGPCSGGIHTIGGAAMNAVDLDVETSGDSSAAIRSDRGGGTVRVEGGTFVTGGTGSPAVYSTADIAVSGAVLTAANSEAVVVEGKNSATFTDCALTGCMADSDEAENIHNIMLYQSMSGDADEGVSRFSATGGSITSEAGDMFYITNTACEIALCDVLLSLSNDVLMRVCGNTDVRGWGKPGQNGGSCTFTAVSQNLMGNILVDDISSLDMTLSEGSIYGGCINPDDRAGVVNVTLGEGCLWILTGDCHLTSFTGSVSDITTNGYSVFVNGSPIC